MLGGEKVQEIVGIRFKKLGKIYFYSENEFSLVESRFEGEYEYEYMSMIGRYQLVDTTIEELIQKHSTK